jgi:hypothetical protein
MLYSSQYLGYHFCVDYHLLVWQALKTMAANESENAIALWQSA